MEIECSRERYFQNPILLQDVKVVYRPNTKFSVSLYDMERALWTTTKVLVAWRAASQIRGVLPAYRESGNHGECKGRCEPLQIEWLTTCCPMNCELRRTAEIFGVQPSVITPRTFILINMDVPSMCMLACLQRGMSASINCKLSDLDCNNTPG